MSLDCCVLALSTIPDVGGLRRLHRLPESLSDSEVAEYAFQRRRASHVDDFLPPHLQRVAAFAVARLEGGRFSLCSAVGADEGTLLSRLFEALADAEGVSRWSEQEASLGCLRTRAMLASQRLPAALVMPDKEDAVFGAWLAGAGEASSLSAMAGLAGMPLINGFQHERIWKQWLDANQAAVHAEVELRALTAWILQLKHQVAIGRIEPAEPALATGAMRRYLDHPTHSAPHLAAFLQDWCG